MLRWIRRRLKPITHGMLATLVSLWLVADATPCAMAQPLRLDRPCQHCPMPPMQRGMNSDRGQVVPVNCKLPDVTVPLAAALGDFTVTPVLLTTLPVSMMLPQTRQHPQNDLFTPDIPAPPLHIQHLTLIL